MLKTAQHTIKEDIVNRRQRPLPHWAYRAGCHVIAFTVFATITPLTSERAAARDRPATEDERKACTPDVFRLCSSVIPNVEAITACLRTKFSSLSDQCRYVMSAHDGSKTQAGSK